MNIKQCLAVGALAALPFAADAQQAARGASQQADPLEASAAVPALIYDSAFRHYQPEDEASAPPDEVWRAANEEVGRLGGHAGHIKANASASQAPAPARTETMPMPMQHGHHRH